MSPTCLIVHCMSEWCVCFALLIVARSNIYRHRGQTRRAWDIGYRQHVICFIFWKRNFSMITSKPPTTTQRNPTTAAATQACPSRTLLCYCKTPFLPYIMLSLTVRSMYVRQTHFSPPAPFTSAVIWCLCYNALALSELFIHCLFFYCPYCSHSACIGTPTTSCTSDITTAFHPRSTSWTVRSLLFFIVCCVILFYFHLLLISSHHNIVYIYIFSGHGPVRWCFYCQ